MKNISAAALYDPRVNVFRPSLADIRFRDSIPATRYTDSILRQCVRGVVPLFAEPNLRARQISQIRYGELLDVFEIDKDGFAWVQNRMDRYVGYFSCVNDLSEEISDLTHRINVLRTYVYPEPDIKTPPLDELTLSSYVHLTGGGGDFRELVSGGFVFAKHIAKADDALTPDYVFTAGRLLHVPYLWGGRTPTGIDCSGLVQLALEMAGIDAPRDSDQQCELFGQPLSRHWRDMIWKRGDIVFFPGHVGIMVDSENMIHASAHDMKVIVEPVFNVVMRGNEILAAGRP